MGTVYNLLTVVFVLEVVAILCNAIRIVKGPPQWKKQKEMPVFVARPVRSSVKLNCRAYGKPIPDITWYKNNEVIGVNDEARKYHFRKWTMEIKDLANNDNGNYTCLVENRHGKIMWTYTLEVIDNCRFARPRITGLVNTTVAAGATAIMECKVSVEGSCLHPMYQWLKHYRVNGSYVKPDGTPNVRIIHTDQTQFLRIANVTKESAGWYTCLVRNDVGRSFKSAWLTVVDDIPSASAFAEKVKIRNVMAFEKGRKTLKCKVTGYPPPIQKWYKDGKFIKYRHSKRYRFTRQALNINPVTKKDEGVFSCRSLNGNGGISHKFLVKVVSAVPELEGPHKITRNISVFKNERVKLKCKARGHPKPFQKWTKDRITISTTYLKRYKINKHSLTINSVAENDDGIFTCISWNKNGNVTRSFKVSVQPTKKLIQDKKCLDAKKGPPKWKPAKKQGHWIARPAGAPVEFKCEACGNPRPIVKWKKNGHDIFSDGKYKLRGRKLRIVDLDVTDNGNYTCLVRNKYGMISWLYTLEVIERCAAPEITGLVDTKAKLGETVQLQCLIRESCRQSHHIQWIKHYQVNGSYVSPDGTPYITLVQQSTLNVTDPQILRMKNVTMEDTGWYTCLVSNSFGRRYKTAWLSINNDAS